ncbi:hypothetical protein V1499_11135 [Neobacillus sp. SCS-31]|uniref:hypothetical protein n=1 Tax=Neobacillus oceani TaxID=3115292 RepID=UPI0039057DA0
MIELKDIIRFKKELYFNGAVQVDWFYNKEKQNEIAKSFVFHGPEYFGVSEEDLTFKSHRLVDTASFANILTNKLYGESALSNFFMTIAPYGTGKSHLAVTLASLFSGNEELQKGIISNIDKVDKKIGSDIKDYHLKPNLVLVLNGMKDFNLNYEILNATQKVLDLHDVSSDFLKTITKSYDIAKNFVSNTFENFEEQYQKFAMEILDNSPSTNLKGFLLKNILQDSNVFEVINKVYYNINGTYIRWDEGVSAGDILSKIAETLCGDRGKFNKVVVFFDEFGRYIEYASSYPTRAGDSALQQIYEAVQDSEDKIIFVGFIQSDLKSYLTRVDRTANINRYIGRYEASEKIHLSSNLETIFANLIERTKPKEFKDLVVTKIEKNIGEWKKFHELFISWVPQSKNSSVWGSFDHFKKVVLEGIYPLHPLTAWMLSNLSSWLQQRSSLTFLERQIEAEGEKELNEFGDLLVVPATRIIRTEFFKELLAAEQEGRKQSEYCILYNQILARHGDKLDDRQKELLAANLIIRIGRLKTKSLEETKQALAYASTFTIKEVESLINQLEHDYGIISYDESANVFDFVADAIGINDFKRLVNSKKRKLDINLSLVFDNAIDQVLPLEKMDTAFGRKNQISTNEWQFNQQIIHIDDITKNYLLNLVNDWEQSTSPDKPKGKLVWIYISSDTDKEKIESVSKLLERFEFNKKPIAFFILDDQEDMFYGSLIDYQISNLFTPQEKEKYSRFIQDFKDKADNLVKDRFSELVSKRIILTKKGLTKIDKRPKLYMDSLFEELYYSVIPFPFTEFSNKTLGKAKKNLSRIGRLILSGAAFQVIHSETSEIKNRIEGVLFEKRLGSWGIFNSDYQLISPTNLKVRKIYEELDELVEQKGSFGLDEVFDIYQRPPYGINDYALALLIATYLIQRKIELRVSINDDRLRLEEWGNEIFTDKQVNFKGLFDTSIIKVDPDKSAGRYLALYNKVERNNDIDLCPSLWKEYERLKLEEDIPQELEDKVMNLEMILKDGLKLQEQNLRYIGGLKSKFSDALRSNTSFKEIFEVLDGCDNIGGAVNGSAKYVYNSRHIEEANNMINKCHGYINEKFANFVTNLKCQSYAQVSGFEKWVKQIIESLIRYNYHDEARKLRTKLTQILDDLTIIQKLQNINDTVQNYLSRNRPNNTTGYNDLIKMKNEGKEILDLLLNHKVDKNYLNENIEKVNNNLIKIEEYINKLTEEVSEIYDSMYELSTVEESQNFLLHIKSVLNKSINEVDREGIEQAANDLQNFLNDIQNLEKYKDNRKELILELSGLKNKWVEIESEIEFAPILENHKSRLIARLNHMEERWAVNYINIRENLNTLDASECTTWINHTKVIPSYISDSTIETLKEIKRLINKRLNELEVDAVISLFSNLTDEQKVIALAKLQTLVNASLTRG